MIRIFNSLLSSYIALFLCISLGWSNAPLVDLSKESPQYVNLLVENRFEVTATAADDGTVEKFTWKFTAWPNQFTTTPPPISLTGVSANTESIRFSITETGQYDLQLIVTDNDGNESESVIVVSAFLPQTFYVSSSGDDLTDINSISESKPLSTISKAMEIAGLGDTIILLPDSISAPAPSDFEVNTIDLIFSGTESYPFSIIGSSKAKITIKPTGSNVGFRVNNQNHIKISNLSFEGWSNSAISLSGVSTVTIDSCEFYNNDTAVRIKTSDKVIIAENKIYDNTSGIQVEESSNILVQDNYIYRNSDYGFHILSVGQSSANTVINNTFYDNGTTYDNGIKNAAVNLESSAQNTVKYNLFVNNIKDYYHIDGTTQAELNSNVSFLNVGAQRDEKYLSGTTAANWEIEDPLLVDPENGDFRLITSSPAIGKFFLPNGSQINIGAYQGIAVTRPTTRIIYVDLDNASNSLIQTGQSGTPFDSIDKALLLAGPGDRVLVKASSLQDYYTIDLRNLQTQVPGWGNITIEGINKSINGTVTYPTLSCFPNGENVLTVSSQKFITLKNFVFTGFKNNSSGSCLNGISVNNSRHIEISQIISHAMSNAGIVVDSSEAVHISSAVIFDNTHAMQLSNNSSRNQYNYYDKFTMSDNLNGLSIKDSFKSTFINSIFYNKSSSCLTTDSIEPPEDFDIRYSFCGQSGTISNLFSDPVAENITGNLADKDPLFVSEDKTYQRTNPWQAFRLKKLNTTISEALNAGQPDYPLEFVLNEFANPSASSTPISKEKSVTGVIDMGAFEQSRTDVDNDGIDNEMDSTKGLDPNNPNDAQADFDNDGLSNYFELSSTPSTDITSADTDNDGLDDGVEVGIGSDPTVDDANSVIGLLPKPYIEPHATSVLPGLIHLIGAEMSGKNVTNQWKLLRAPDNVTEDDIFISQTFESLTIEAIIAGEYEISLDQQLIPNASINLPLGSLEQDRAITTITVQDVPPTPVLPPSITVSYNPDQIVYFYGSSTAKNPSFDANNDSIESYEWLQVSPLNPQLGLIDSINSPNPRFTIPNRSAIYQWKLKLTSKGPNGVSSSYISENVFEIQVQGEDFSLPVAEAGLETYLTANNINQINGSGSIDPDKNELKYYWRQIGGSTVQFTNLTAPCQLSIFRPSEAGQVNCVKSSTAEYIATQAGVVEFELVVSKTHPDANGDPIEHFSKPDSVIHIIDAIDNAVPEAAVSAQKEVYIGKSTRLYGSASRDRRSDPNQNFSTNLQYSWKQISGPPVQFSTNTPDTEFIPSTEGLYEFSLEVSDEQNITSKTEEIQIRVISDNLTLPVADAGDDSVNLIGRVILLNGSQSTGGKRNGFDEPITNYLWTQTAGPSIVNIGNINQVSTSFIPTEAGLYTFSLVVYTDEFSSFKDYVNVAISSDAQSVPVAIPNVYAQSEPRLIPNDNTLVPQFTIVALDGSQSFDRDGDPLSYLWQQTSGQPVTLSNPSGRVVTFEAETGSYEFSLIVNDTKVSSIPAKAVITVVNENEKEEYTLESFVRFDPTFVPGPKSKSGCFIVSASFGEYSLITKYFQLVRDHLILKTKLGSSLINLYYLYSPPLAELIQNHTFLRFLSICLLLFLLAIGILLPLIILKKIINLLLNTCKLI